MKNVTISLDEKVAKWARIQAAEQEMSVSRFIGEMLRATMLGTQRYQKAMRRNLARKPVTLSSGSYPSREELHERALLRR